MIKSDTKLKAWGNSVGIILPKDRLKEEGLSVDDEVEITVRKKESSIKDAFGILRNFKARTKKSTEELLREIDDEFKSKYE